MIKGQSEGRDDQRHGHGGRGQQVRARRRRRATVLVAVEDAAVVPRGRGSRSVRAVKTRVKDMSATDRKTERRRGGG